MDLKQLAPWNWFKDEENETGSQVAVSRTGQKRSPEQRFDPVSLLHRNMDDLFSRFLYGTDMTPRGEGGFSQGLLGEGLLKPMVDINASDGEYSITIEIPGIKQEDINLEISNNTLTVSGEKNQEKEDQGKDYYRMERSYGTFQRVLSLPDDVDQDRIKASFDNGVLTVTTPRKPLADRDIKQIEVK